MCFSLIHQHNSKLGLVSRHFKPNSTDWKQYNTVETIPLYFSAVVRLKHKDVEEGNLQLLQLNVQYLICID